jgi:hypothetical protein
VNLGNNPANYKIDIFEILDSNAEPAGTGALARAKEEYEVLGRSER